MSEAMTARCPCGQLGVACQGEPVRISVCHCHDCQRRSGSAFSAQIRFAEENVTVSGEHRSWTRIADSGNEAHFHFCPICGTTMFYEIDAMPGVRAIPMGAFAGIELPRPWVSVYENRKAPWIELIGDIEHD